MTQGKIIGTLVIVSLSSCMYLMQGKMSQKEVNVFFSYIVLQIVAYVVTYLTISSFKQYLLRAEMFGMDINKKGTKGGEVKIPECAGLIPATVYLIFMMIGLSFNKVYFQDLVFEHASALLSIAFIIILGFADDVFDLPWRYKIILPVISSLPILVSYSGATTILLPSHLIDIGILYYIYMAMLIIFATNSINIYAGINGIESGQSIIIALSILIHNVIEIVTTDDLTIYKHHFFSIIIIVPYISTTWALFQYNKYPSIVFVGDTFCYWSGTTFAIAGILGHFSKTLLLFFIPQIINFLYSLPQLFKIIPCPRHRLPKFNQKTGKLECIKSNLTLINLALWIKGPTTEKDLCSFLLIFQAFTSLIGFLIRYYLPSLIYNN